MNGRWNIVAVIALCLHFFSSISGKAEDVYWQALVELKNGTTVTGIVKKRVEKFVNGVYIEGQNAEEEGAGVRIWSAKKLDFSFHLYKDIAQIYQVTAPPQQESPATSQQSPPNTQHNPVNQQQEKPQYHLIFHKLATDGQINTIKQAIQKMTITEPRYCEIVDEKISLAQGHYEVTILWLDKNAKQSLSAQIVRETIDVMGLQMAITRTSPGVVYFEPIVLGMPDNADLAAIPTTRTSPVQKTERRPGEYRLVFYKLNVGQLQKIKQTLADLASAKRGYFLNVLGGSQEHPEQCEFIIRWLRNDNMLMVEQTIKESAALHGVTVIATRWSPGFIFFEEPAPKVSLESFGERANTIQSVPSPYTHKFVFQKLQKRQLQWIKKVMLDLHSKNFCRLIGSDTDLRQGLYEARVKWLHSTQQLAIEKTVVDAILAAGVKVDVVKWSPGIIYFAPATVQPSLQTKKPETKTPRIVVSPVPMKKQVPQIETITHTAGSLGLNKLAAAKLAWKQALMKYAEENIDSRIFTHNKGAIRKFVYRQWRRYITGKTKLLQRTRMNVTIRGQILAQKFIGDLWQRFGPLQAQIAIVSSHPVSRLLHMAIKTTAQGLSGTVQLTRENASPEVIVTELTVATKPIRNAYGQWEWHAEIHCRGMQRGVVVLDFVLDSISVARISRHRNFSIVVDRGQGESLAKQEAVRRVAAYVARKIIFELRGGR